MQKSFGLIANLKLSLTLLRRMRGGEEQIIDQ
jgi:hypothetical protein